MSTQTMPSPELYFDTIFAFQRSAALKSAIDLEVFTAIGDGAWTVTDTAKAGGVPTRGIRILRDYLTSIGFLTKSGEAYELTPMLAGTSGGDAYTFGELRGMLTEAGFKDVTAHPLHGPQTVLIATK